MQCKLGQEGRGEGGRERGEGEDLAPNESGSNSWNKAPTINYTAEKKAAQFQGYSIPGNSVAKISDDDKFRLAQDESRV